MSPCPHCANHCNRTLVEFSSGASYVTGNRCPRGEMLGEAGSSVPKTVSAPDLYLRREALLFKKYDFTPVSGEKNVTIGLPHTLEFWDSIPFWTTFFHALGFRTRFSSPSSRKQFERGIPFVPSDTVCFPAKLAHGHIRDLVDQGVDRIFMPMVMEMPTESPKRKSNYVCAVVKGYPPHYPQLGEPGPALGGALRHAHVPLAHAGGPPAADLFLRGENLRPVPRRGVRRL